MSWGFEYMIVKYMSNNIAILHVIRDRDDS